MSATGVENIGGGRTPLPGTRGTDQWPMVSPLLLLSDTDSLLYIKHKAHWVMFCLASPGLSLVLRRCGMWLTCGHGHPGRKNDWGYIIHYILRPVNKLLKGH